jgi:hypothetical protein
VREGRVARLEVRPERNLLHVHGRGRREREAREEKAVKQAVAIGGGKAPADLSDRDLADAGIVRTRALTKWCRICEKVKPEAKFRADGRTSDGLATICDGCRESETALSAAEPATVDIPNVELLSTGGPYFGQGSPPEGDFFTEEDLDELAAAYAALHDEVRIPVKVGHGRKQTLLKNSGLVVPPDADVAADELPAAGWVENVRRDGGKLLGDLRKVPRKLADLMKLDAFRTRSIELSRVTSQTLGGREFPNVLTGLAVLGAKAPAVRTLDDILAWYAEAHPDVELVPAASLLLADEEPDDAELRTYASGDVVWSAEDGCNDWMDDLVETLNGDGGDSYGPDGMWIPPRYSILDLDQVNRRALVSDRDVDDDYCWIVPFTLDAQGDPEPASRRRVDARVARLDRGGPADRRDRALRGGRPSPGGLVSGDGDLRSSPITSALPRRIAGGADTRPMSLLAQFNDQQVAAFAGALGIDESDPAALREAVAHAFGSRGDDRPAPDSDSSGASRRRRRPRPTAATAPRPSFRPRSSPS